jgi:signal transduction histidine kinase/streptogramin lyase
VVATAARAAELPLRRFTTSDGLASNDVYCVKRDSRGFLWFCTAEGISRFDGYSFTNYGMDQGLPDRMATDFLEMRNGELWVGTARGLARFNPRPNASSRLFTLYPLDKGENSQHINSLFEDREGVLWVTTDGGVFYSRQLPEHRTFQLLNTDPSISEGPADFIGEDPDGNLWVTYGRDQGTVLWRRGPEGHTETLTNSFLSHDNRITSFLIDKQGRVWVTTFHGLALLARHPSSSNLFTKIFHKTDGLGSEETGGLFESSDGKLWVNSGGLLQIVGDGSEVEFKRYAQTEPLGSIFGEDSGGNLWMGNVRLATHGFLTFGRADGLRTEDVRSIFEGSDNQLYVVTGFHGRYIHRFNGKRFVAVAPLVPGHNHDWDWGGWGWGQTHFQDHEGEWWFATWNGLFRYPKVRRLEDLAHTPPKAIYTPRDGLGGIDVFRLYEDSQGDIWISTFVGYGLTRWERATERFHILKKETGFEGAASAFREDHTGNIWLGIWNRNLARYRRGKFEVLRVEDGFPDGMVNSIWLDHAGRIWAGTSRGGLVRIDEPDAEKVHYRVYSTKDGLSSNNVRSITEDHWGRIYFWTGTGVDRLEPETGGLVHYTTADGLVPSGSDNQEAFCDRQGNLWFGFNGLSRLTPLPDSGDPPPFPVYIRRILVHGAPLPISELGETNLTGLVFQPNQNDIQIEFGTFNFDTREMLRFQYKLEGTDKEWSQPTDVRAVNFAEIRPGTYRFAVRALNGRGQMSAVPALVSFQVLAPIWARWWFLTLAATLIALAGYGLYQLRVNQLLEVERVRTRIASDLHDDVGSGLTQIAILSELAQREDASDKSVQLSRIADLSRELVDGMSEIVWAMNPQRDQLADLVRRMRRFASDIFEARGIEFEFRAPAADSNLPLRSDLRRQVYLIFKEAINNSVRHSKCTRVDLVLSAEKGELFLKISDNGCGLRESQSESDGGQGHGLKNMRKRALDLKGTLEIASLPGGGTEILLRVPIARTFTSIAKAT